MDTDTGATCGTGQSGEVWIKTAGVMRGYLNNPRATADMIDRDDWLHTGILTHACFMSTTSPVLFEYTVLYAQFCYATNYMCVFRIKNSLNIGLGLTLIKQQ